MVEATLKKRPDHSFFLLAEETLIMTFPCSLNHRAWGTKLEDCDYIYVSSAAMNMQERDYTSVVLSVPTIWTVYLYTFPLHRTLSVKDALPGVRTVPESLKESL